MHRRHYLAAAGLVGTAGLAGCLDESPLASTGGIADEPDDNDEDDATDERTIEATPDGPEATARAFLRAVDAGDGDAFAALVHGSSSLHPDNFDATTDGEGTDRPGLDIESFDTELDDTGLTVADLRAIPGAKLFVEDDLATVVEGSDTALVSATMEPGDTAGEAFEDEVEIVLVTENGEWTILWWLPARSDPDEIRDDSIIDEEGRVVDAVSFDTSGARHRARVEFADAPDVDVVTVESTVFGASATMDDPSATDTATITLDPNGDELVVSATIDGTTEVVHRVPHNV
ncbi:hypothetical protein [Natrinema pallidum]|uniref:Lipoprotein n=1 Tax=Natrinema pallidum DSM 3751 TaxID=1227495 RepID=L9YZ73_9EURY|nr:hypothetical protein [Natrinema pallidum]ELY78936.1 hypothetical protein C487_06910 [Natrinema pallidum DSM 3751]